MQVTHVEHAISALQLCMRHCCEVYGSCAEHWRPLVLQCTRYRVLIFLHLCTDLQAQAKEQRLKKEEEDRKAREAEEKIMRPARELAAAILKVRHRTFCLLLPLCPYVWMLSISLGEAIRFA